MDLSPLPQPVQDYLRALTRVLKDALGPELVGVYLFGSAAQGGYEPGVSDLDVQAVGRSPQPETERRVLAARLTHAALPCPARQLEFVLYPHARVWPEASRPMFDLNLNTGPGRADHLTLDPAQESPHWFVLDIALGRTRGQALFGPPPGEVFGEVPRRTVLKALAQSQDWHAGHDALAPNRVLNAARSWRYLETGKWGTKGEGVAWAQARTPHFAVAGQAWRARHTGEALDRAAVAEFMAFLDALLAARRGLGTPDSP